MGQGLTSSCRVWVSKWPHTIWNLNIWVWNWECSFINLAFIFGASFWVLSHFGAKFQISGAIAAGRKFPDNRSIYPTVAAPPGGGSRLGGVSSSGTNRWSFLAGDLCGHALLPNLGCPAACRINEYLEVNKSRDRLRKICLNFLPVLHLWLPPSPVFIWGRLSVISVSLSTPILLGPAQDSQGRFVSPQFSQKSSQLLICWRRGCAIYSKNDNRPTCCAICQVSLLNVSTWRPCLQKVPSNVTTAYTQCMYIAHKKYALSSTIHVPNEPMHDCMFSE